VVNIPFAVQPVQRAFEAIDPEIREAAQCCGLTFRQAMQRIELPLAWPGILSACVLTFAHTLGEFGVVLMVGGNIPGETQTVAISIYDRSQAFDHASAGAMALLLLLVSLVTIAISYGLVERLHAASAGVMSLALDLRHDGPPLDFRPNCLPGASAPCSVRPAAARHPSCGPLRVCSSSTPPTSGSATGSGTMRIGMCRRAIDRSVWCRSTTDCFRT
jgi:hypothetical protein